MSKRYGVHLRCENGHEQHVILDVGDREEAVTFAGLLDGSSPLFVHKPGPESLMHRCGICRGSFKATVSDGGDA